MANTRPHVIKWCEAHPGCKGCKLVGNECVAPVSDHKFNDWLDYMSELIAIENGDSNEKRPK